MKQSKPINATALAIKSEMTPAGPRSAVRRVAGFRRLEGIRLREYQDGNMASVDMVSWFLQDVEQATRADMSGATGLAWATIDNAIKALEHERHLRRIPNTDPEEYAWKH